MKWPWTKKKDPPVLTLSDQQTYNLTLLLNVWITPAAINRLAWYSLINNVSSLYYIRMWMWAPDQSVIECAGGDSTYRSSLCQLLLYNEIVPKSHLTAAVSKAIVLIAERVEEAKLRGGVGIDFINSVDV